MPLCATHHVLTYLKWYYFTSLFGSRSTRTKVKEFLHKNLCSFRNPVIRGEGQRREGGGREGRGRGKERRGGFNTCCVQVLVEI